MLSAKADIRNVPRHDLENIERLFEDLIDNHDYSYAIFGSKPMSLADFNLKVPENLSLYRRLRSKFFLVKRRARLKSWYKHRREFNFEDFIFLDEESDWLDCLVLILINKKNMLQVLRDNEAIFKEEIGESFTPESFLERLEKREISFAKATGKNQRLIGIMLGYGERNATIFQKRFDLMKVVARRKKENLPEDETMKKELDAIESRIACFSEPEADATIHPLYFLADVSHPETVALKRKYEQEREQIIELRKKGNFMDLVLQRLASAE
ncbi:MAG: hypothetical protein K940chlam9_01260 [Chlamydiae bacterium]|nr:hypothetical protein [Chlamydiota bacterium]